MYLDSVFLEEKGFKEYFMWCGILFEKKVSFSPKMNDQKSFSLFQQKRFKGGRSKHDISTSHIF